MPQFIPLTLCSLVPVSIIFYPIQGIQAFSTNTNTNTKQLPPSPDTPSSRNNRPRPGGGQDPLTSCASLEQEPVALVPVRNPVYTISDHPTFLFYIPYRPEEIASIEFIVNAGRREETRLYRGQLTLPQSPGIVSVSLPNQPNYALHEGETYRWYLKIRCSANPDTLLVVDASIQRLAATPERIALINEAAPDIWYDAIAQVISRRQSSPQNELYQRQWLELLRHIGEENLGNHHFSGQLTPLE